MRRSLIVVIGVAFAAALVLSGCGAVGSSYDVRIVNETTVYFDDINISDSSASTWGDDQMPPDTMLDPDEEIVLVGVAPISTPDSVDVRAQDRLLGYEYTGYGLDVTQTIYIRSSGITN